MNKLHLLHEAEKLYSIENLTPEMIAEKLNVSRRTVFNWKKKYKWNNHIVRIKDFSNQFAGDIYNIGAKLLFLMYEFQRYNLYRLFYKHYLLFDNIEFVPFDY